MEGSAMWARNAVSIGATNTLTRREVLRPAAAMQGVATVMARPGDDCTRR
jgi:hypothetical protein